MLKTIFFFFLFPPFFPFFLWEKTSLVLEPSNWEGQNSLPIDWTKKEPRKKIKETEKPRKFKFWSLTKSFRTKEKQLSLSTGSLWITALWDPSCQWDPFCLWDPSWLWDLSSSWASALICVIRHLWGSTSSGGYSRNLSTQIVRLVKSRSWHLMGRVSLFQGFVGTHTCQIQWSMDYPSS